MNIKNKDFTSIVNKYWGYLILGLLLGCMLLIHRYIFLYADDLYYCRDASYGLSHLPHFTWSELKANGRVWIGLAMLAVLKNQIAVFRIFNPVMITLTAFLMARITTYSQMKDGLPDGLSPKEISTALFCSSLFFLYLPVQISHTTIYYVACAFNYLYPTALTMLYAYILFRSTKKPDQRLMIKSLIMVLAFLAGSSTQQGGMIAIGFTVLITFYFTFFKKQSVFHSYIPYYISLLSGFTLILYGSFNRLLFEKHAGNTVNPIEVITGLLRINIFSQPAALFVLLTCLSCIFWFAYCGSKVRHSLHPFLYGLSRMLLVLLSLAIPGYIYVVLFKSVPVELFSDGTRNMILSFTMLAFTGVYLFSILLSSWMILLIRDNPFPFFNSICAIGAQLMLLIVNARFAQAYKMMFPSLLLMSIFIIFSIIQFHRNKTFIFLAVTLISLSIALMTDRWSAAIVALLVLILSIVFRSFFKASALISLSLALLVFGTTYAGYQKQAIPQIDNLEAIERYHQSTAKDKLILKKVPVSPYGYNLDNWNNMPYFMKQCYQIDPETRIEYQE